MADFDNAFNTLQKGQESFDPGAAYQKGITQANERQAMNYKLSDLARQNTQATQDFQDKQAARESMQNRVTTDENGNAVLDVQGVSNDLMKQNPMLRNQLLKSLGTDDIDLANQRMQKNQQFIQQLAPDGSNLGEVRQAAIKAGLTKEWQNAPTDGGPNTIWAMKQGAQSLSSQIENHMNMLKMTNERFMKGIEKGVIPAEFLPGGQTPAALGGPEQNSNSGKPSGSISPNSPAGYILPQGPMDKEGQKAFDDTLANRKLNDPAYANAGTSLAAVKNANSIFDKYKDKDGNYNFDNLNTQEQHILAGEAAKAIKGGGAAATQDEVEALLPKNVMSGASNMWAKISSKPVPTNNNEYYQNLHNYFQDLKQNSMDSIQAANTLAEKNAQAFGINPNSLAAKKAAKEQELHELANGMNKKSSQYDPDVVKYYNTHKSIPGMSLEKAQQIKMQRLGSGQ